MATPDSTTGFQLYQNIPLPSTVNASATNEFLFYRSARDVRFLEIGVIAAQTITSGAPVTNTLRAEIWNVTDATKLAQATITGVTSGSALERGKFVSIATRNQFIGPGADASLAKTFSIKFVGANTLNRGIVRGLVNFTADYLIS